MNHDQWMTVFPGLDASGIVAGVLANSVWAESDGGRIKLQLDPSQSAIFNDDMVPRLEQVLARYFGQPVQLQVVIEDATQETPAARSRRQRAENQQQLVAQFENDASVQTLLTRFSGRLMHDTIAPLED